MTLFWLFSVLLLHMVSVLDEFTNFVASILSRPANKKRNPYVECELGMQGFCHVSSVDPGTVADRAGLRTVYQAACAAGKLLVVSRLGGEKITPWLVSSAGSIRCFDTVSMSNKLSLHRQTGQSVRLHVMVWDGALHDSSGPHGFIDDPLGRNKGIPFESSRVSYSTDDEQPPLYYESEEKPYVKGPVEDLAGFHLTSNGHAEPSLMMGTLYQNKYLNEKMLWRSMNAHP
jgi:hypothetical protein